MVSLIWKSGDSILCNPLLSPSLLGEQFISPSLLTEQVIPSWKIRSKVQIQTCRGDKHSQHTLYIFIQAKEKGEGAHTWAQTWASVSHWSTMPRRLRYSWSSRQRSWLVASSQAILSLRTYYNVSEITWYSKHKAIKCFIIMYLNFIRWRPSTCKKFCLQVFKLLSHL